MQGDPRAASGEWRRHRRSGALDLCCRRGEMLLIQNKRVNWEPPHSVQPARSLAAIVKRRATLGPEGYVLGSTRKWLAALDDFRNWLIRDAA